MKGFLFNITKRLRDWYHAQWLHGKVHSSSVSLQNHIGKHCRIGKHSFVGHSSMGDYSYCSGFNIIVNTQIGKFCSIGSFVSICTGKHPSTVFVSTSPVFYSKSANSFADKEYFKESGAVHIGHDVWIGSNVVIIDDVNIGTGAIIAAGSIVTKDVPPYAIYGGVPARLIKMRFDEATIQALLASEWWQHDDAWFKEHYKLMHNSEDFLQFLKQEKKNG